MLIYTNGQLATVIALPAVTSLLIWTIVIFHKNRKSWGPYDIPIVAVLSLSIVRNVSVFAYVLAASFADKEGFDLEYCSVAIWIFNSIHTFQASSLTTVAVIGLFSVKLHRKQQNLKLFLTPTHIVYHLFCLTTLCACVGVAAILAQGDVGAAVGFAATFGFSPCRFMPFDLDVKFNVFILVLHAFLAFVSLCSFVLVCFDFLKNKKDGFDYLKKSNSDLSDMSVSLNAANAENHQKNYYDTYTIHKDNNYFDKNQNNYLNSKDGHWNSDLSNISTTVSSTNSRRPCLMRKQSQAAEKERRRTGMETIHPVLIVCYLFYHLPLIVLCIHPKLIYPWPVAGIALWLGLVQDVLIPIGLGIVDSRFCKWVSNVYKCSKKSVEEKLPHVGLDGKFRPFGLSSQPQSLEVANIDRNTRSFQAVEHRFPITNGSLYTSIDGRLPVIHNYRRNKDPRGIKTLEKQSSNVAIHSSHINGRIQQDFADNSQKFPSCSTCETDLCPSHSNLHHLSPQYINKRLNLLRQNHSLVLNRNIVPLHVSQSQESLHYASEGQKHYFYRNSDLNINANAGNILVKSSRNLVRLNKMRLSRSEDSLNDLQIREFGKMLSKPVQLKDNTQNYSKGFHTKVEVNVQNSYSSSDDDYLTDINDIGNVNDNYDSLSSKSCYSITTEANCDFEFFQSNNRTSGDISFIETQNCPDFYFMEKDKPSMSSFKPQNDLNFRITRSNSKRSLENFQAFVELENKTDDPADDRNQRFTLQRSNSYTTLEDRRKRKNGKRLMRTDSKLSDCSYHFNNIRQKIKSVEYLPETNCSTIFIEDFNHNRCVRNEKGFKGKHVGSVPDLKKIFISEYI